MGDFVSRSVVKSAVRTLAVPIENVTAFTAIVNDIVANAALATAMGGTAVHATDSDTFSATIKCHDANGEV
jgi:hypothetical protein